MSKVIKELADMGLRVRESDSPDRLKIDFSIEDEHDNIAWVWGSGEIVAIDNKEYGYDYEVECDHAVIEYDDDETVGECLVCGKYCDWHWEGDGEYRERVPHDWHEGDGGLINKYINECYERSKKC